MNLFERCMKLYNCDSIIESETMIPMCISETSNMTFPPGTVNQYDYELDLFCKHVYYISDIHLVHKIVKKFNKKATDEQVTRYIRKIAKDMFTPEIKESMSSYEDIFILFGGDVSSDFEIAKVFYTEFMKILGKGHNTNVYVFAVLGNHEFWSFNNINDCHKAYEGLFGTLGIKFLNNDIEWFGEHTVPTKRFVDKIGGITRSKSFSREEDEEEYDLQMQYIHNVLIVGGVGFAGCNHKFNADEGIYRNALTRADEIEETLKWGKAYKRALQLAREENSALIVLTHNPINDWNEKGLADSNCIYFNGHNHRNDIQHDDERNIHIFSDNQVGYYSTKIQFKEAYIYSRINPFAMYSDGYHEVRSADYFRFYDFMREKITGNGKVERQLKNNNGHFYMIKHKGYYGFFLESDNGTYICAGGAIKKIDKLLIIELINKNFLNMIHKYLSIISPYRNAQEQIAEAVKAFGGDGTIHGCIIDIDFFNHIMLNPNDGSITYYYSPVFGLVEKHDSLLSLLDNHNILLAEQYRNQIGSKEYEIEKIQSGNSGELVEVDIKNSMYRVSSNVNQLQRLFSKKILRDWDEELLMNEKSLLE